MMLWMNVKTTLKNGYVKVWSSKDVINYDVVSDNWVYADIKYYMIG